MGAGQEAAACTLRAQKLWSGAWYLTAEGLTEFSSRSTHTTKRSWWPYTEEHRRVLRGCPLQGRLSVGRWAHSTVEGGASDPTECLDGVSGVTPPPPKCPAFLGREVRSYW